MPSEWRSGLGEAKRKCAVRIVQTLVDAGYSAVFAGGCVRDMLMGVEPQDYDIATSAGPEQVAALFEHTIPIGASFGVVAILLDGYAFEVATFRSDGDYADGRHPRRVSFTDARGDVGRRDFTINGMLYDPLAEQVIDYVGGQEDIRRQIVRCIGEAEKRFGEDSLRMLRAIRFAARFGFEIDPATADAIKNAAGGIDRVSAERIAQELCKMLTGRSPHKAIEWMNRTGLLERVLPEVAAMQGVEQPPEFHPEGDVYVHTLRVLELMDAEREEHPPTQTFAMAVLLHDVGKPPTIEYADRIRFNCHAQVGSEIAQSICRRLKMSRDDICSISELVAKHMRLSDAPKMRQTRLKRLLRQADFADHLQLYRLDCLASHGDLTCWRFCVRQREELASEPEPPPSVLSGHDLIEMGYLPGPIFSEILAAVEEAQLDELISTPAEARRLVQQRFPDINQPSETADSD